MGDSSGSSTMQTVVSGSAVALGVGSLGLGLYNRKDISEIKSKNDKVVAAVSNVVKQSNASKRNLTDIAKLIGDIDQIIKKLRERVLELEARRDEEEVNNAEVREAIIEIQKVLIQDGKNVEILPSLNTFNGRGGMIRPRSRNVQRSYSSHRVRDTGRPRMRDDYEDDYDYQTRRDSRRDSRRRDDYEEDIIAGSGVGRATSSRTGAMDDEFDDELLREMNAVRNSLRRGTR
jgi:DNA-binding protein H-NS